MCPLGSMSSADGTACLVAHPVESDADGNMAAGTHPAVPESYCNQVVRGTLPAFPTSASADHYLKGLKTHLASSKAT